MSSVLVVGADGFIGAALAELAREKGHEVMRTTRRARQYMQAGDLRWPPQSDIFCDLMHPPAHFPFADVAFLCAGVADYRKCEGSAEAWRTNVDGPIAVAKTLLKMGTFIVYLSSVAAEWATHSAYGRAKAHVELALRCLGDPAIVRFERVTAERLPGVVSGLLAIGIGRTAGVHHL